jgi:hypothetical protein
MRNVTDKSVEKNTSTVDFSPENRTVYDIMWKNVVERGRPQMTT